LHTYEVHCPYDAPAEYTSLFTGGRSAPIDIAGMCGKDSFNNMELEPEEIAWIRDHYDAGIRYTDELLEQFLRTLGDIGVTQNTLIIITSDHGESLGEGGWFGHNRLHPTQYLVPWIMAGPGLPQGRVVEQPAQLADLLPTILDYLGLPAPSEPALGSSLMPAIHGKQIFESTRLRVCETRTQRALISGPWLLVQRKHNGTAVSLYRVDLDPEGEENLLDSEPQVVQKILAEWTRQAEYLGIQ